MKRKKGGDVLFPCIICSPLGGVDGRERERERERERTGRRYMRRTFMLMAMFGEMDEIHVMGRCERNIMFLSQ